MGEMAAGARLDALVCRQVLGWTTDIDGNWRRPDMAQASTALRCPRYSTSWAAMGELVAHFTGRGYCVSFGSDAEETAGERWHCTLQHWPGSAAKVPGAWGYAEAATAPHAAALAALQTGAGAGGSDGT
jgi:hypothetical protein